MGYALRGEDRQCRPCLGVRVGGPGAQGVALGGRFLSCGEYAWVEQDGGGWVGSEPVKASIRGVDRSTIVCLDMVF